MGREVRMVPPGWEHPKYPADYYESHLRGRYIPLHKSGFAEADSEWSEGYEKWQEGFVRDYGGENRWRQRTAEEGPTYTLWSGARPSPDEYMPQWSKDEATMYVMYEDTSEGTPISPAFSTPEGLARWLADNGASAFGDMTASYEQWLMTCNGAFAPSMVIEGGRIMSGVEFIASA